MGEEKKLGLFSLIALVVGSMIGGVHLTWRVIWLKEREQEPL